MNTSRWLLTTVVVFVVRTSMNFVFYGLLMTGHMQALREKHPGVFREVIPGFVTADLIWAAVFCLLFAWVGGALGGGVGAGVKLAVLVALLGQVLGNLYMHFSVTYTTTGMILGDCVYALVAHSVQGAVAGLVYKRGASPAA